MRGRALSCHARGTRWPASTVSCGNSRWLPAQVLKSCPQSQRVTTTFRSLPCAPRHLSTDHDPLFEARRWTADLRLLEVDEIKTVPHVPLSHPFVERLIGTMRREFLDHVLFWNAGDLERKLADFQAYYNAARSHASLGGHTPLGYAGERTAARAEFNHVRWISHCRGMVQLPAAA